MKRFKRISALALTVVMSLSVLLAGCGSKPAAPAPTAAPSTPAATNAATPVATQAAPKQEDLKGEVTVWARNVAAKSMVLTGESFMKKYPNVKIKVVDIGKTEMYDKLTVGLAAGGVGLPDVILLDEVFLSYVTKFPNGFADITSLASKYKNDFMASKWPGVTNNDKIYGLPWDCGPVGMYYRKDIFEQAGIKAEDIKTWDDYIAAGEKVVAATGGKVKMIPLFYEDAVFRVMLSELGTFYCDAKGDIAINNDKAVLALSTMQKMWDKGIAVNARSLDLMTAAHKNGLIASYPSGVWWSGTLKDQMPEMQGKWGVMPLPAFEKGGNTNANWGGANLVLLNSSKNKDAAWKFMEHSLASTESQIAILKNYGIFPSYLPAFNDPYIKESSFYGVDKLWNFFAQIVPKIPPVNYTSDYLEMRKFSENAVTDCLVNKKSPKEALDAAAKAIENAVGRKIAK